MRLDETDGLIHTDVREFVALARRGISDSVPTDDGEPHVDPRTEWHMRRLFGEGGYCSLTLRYEQGEHAFLLQGHVCLRDGRLMLLCLTDASVKHPPREWVAQMRAEGYILAYMYATREKVDTVGVSFLYLNEGRGEQRQIDEQLPLKKLTAFFDKCRASVAVYAAPAVDRVTVRLPSLRTLRFPYAHVREGQQTFMSAVHRTLRHGTRLCAEAPTGIGKTVSVLYPALRALGEGGCEKIFYLTPKTTTVAAVESCLGDLASVGARLRAISICAKERLCQNRLLCRAGHRDDCPQLKTNRLSDAALQLYRENIGVVGRDTLLRVASDYGVCPYELSLCYAELCDLVICDINYLFDPAVYMRRFFDGGGRYAFLIDEAHNLPDRVRDMYTEEISASELLCPTFTFGEHSAFRAAIEDGYARFCELLFAYLKDDLRKDENGEEISFAHGRVLPTKLYPLFSELRHAAEEEIFRAFSDKSCEGDAHRAAARAYYYRMKRLCDTLARFEDGYEWFMQRRGEEDHLKLFCIDPSSIISERLDLGCSAVLFSATLTPMPYYRSLFGLDRSAEVVQVDSPFDPSRLSVAIMDKISTRQSERERTLGAVLRVIAATVGARRGHYMVFTPSFAYCEQLCEAFRARYPKIRTLKQTASMSDAQKADFLAAFDEDGAYLVAFCVMGGIYSEGIDLYGNRLIGAIVVGVGLPTVSVEREAMCAYFDEKYEAGKPYAYVYPGLNKVLQAAGRVIRTEDDRGVLVLIDDRFADPIYKKAIPKHLHGLKFVGDAKGLRMLIDRFWATPM